MNNHPIDFRLSNMGANFETVEELLSFVNNKENCPILNRVHSSRGDYLTAETEDGMQLWFQVDADDENSLQCLDVHFKSSLRTKLVLDGWTDQKDGGLYGLAYMWNYSGDTEFPMNIDIVNAGLFADYESGEFTAQVAAYAYEFELFPDIDTFKSAKTDLAPKSFIPMGTFPIDDEKDWQPSANVILTGKITRIKRATNAYTGMNYWHLLVECLGINLDVLLRAVDVEQEPVVGGYIQGTFYLTARLFPSQNDACLTPLFALETKGIMNGFSSLATHEESYDEPADGWELIAYPVLPDKGVLLIFQNSSETGEGAKPTFLYRFLRYDANGRLIDVRRTKLRGGGFITTAFYDENDHLRIVFSRGEASQEYLYDLDDGIDPHPVQSLGENIARLITDSNGTVYVGRDYSAYREWTGAILSTYNSAGESTGEFYRRGCYRCAELFLDEAEHVRYLTEPVLSLRKIIEKEDGSSYSDGERFPLSRCVGLAISPDGSRLFAECEASDGVSRFYILNREDGYYGSSQILCPPLLIQENCDLYGDCATGKDRIVFRVDDILFVYRLEDVQCDTLEDLKKVRVKNRDVCKSRFYKLELDPGAPASEDSLDFCVRPVIENMQDEAGESLTLAYRKARGGDALTFIQVAKTKENYHLEIGIEDHHDPDRPQRPRVYALLETDFETVYSAFKKVIVECGCPDLSGWLDYTDVVFSEKKD